jgi:predicted nucleic acid-binding protein
MIPDRVVVNASPLIGLLRIKREGLLPALFGEVFIPTTVRDEIAAGRFNDPNAARLGGLSWALTPPDESIPDAVLTWALGRGESSVLASAQRLGAIAVLDDLAARRCARFLEVPLCGTGRILVMAKHCGLISSVNDDLQKLRDSGFRLSDRLVAKLSADAGEEH